MGGVWKENNKFPNRMVIGFELNLILRELWMHGPISDLEKSTQGTLHMVVVIAV